MTPRSSVNGWKCPECDGITVAVHVDDGVTPMFLACRATTGCTGRAVSRGYRHKAGWELLLAWEWYRPTEKWARRKGPDMLAHVKAGGLVLRPLTDEGRKAAGLPWKEKHVHD